MSDDTYYTVLNVPEIASLSEIKGAYRDLIRQVHPDTISNLAPYLRRIAEEKAKEITEAYSVLSSSNKRQEYDEQLAAYRRQTNAETPPPPRSQQASSQSSSGPYCSMCGTSLSASGFCSNCSKFTPPAATPQQTKYNWAFLKRWSRGAFRYTVASSSVHAPQQLDGAQVRAGLEQMRGEAVPAMPNPEICRIFSPSLAAVPICALLIRHSPEESRDPSRHLKKNLSTKPIPFTGKRGHSWEEDQG